MADPNIAANAAAATDEDAFRPVRSVRLYETIVEQIADLVSRGRLKNGDRFPPERRLEELWHVSRPVLREAFRALEMQGVIESRPGGGRYLRAERIPSPAELRGLRLGDDRETLVHVWQARDAVETRAAGLAAERRSRAQLAAIGRPLRMLDTMNSDAYRRADFNFDFHAAVARASGNPVLAQVVLDLLGRFHEAQFPDLPAADDWSSLQADHQPVYDAIATGDAGAAERAMAAHFETARERLDRA